MMPPPPGPEYAKSSGPGKWGVGGGGCDLSPALGEGYQSALYTPGHLLHEEQGREEELERAE